MICFLRSKERGSALFIILIGVALFAALGYAVSNMMRGGNSGTNIAGEQAKLYAGEILDYGRTLRQTVQGLRISNGCSDTDISFENSSTSLNYSHTPATDDDCMVFERDAGGVSYNQPPIQIFDNSHSARSTYGEYVFPSTTSVLGVGTNAQDLITVLHYVKKDICLSINEKLGVPNPSQDAPADEDGMDTKTPFKGSFSTGQAIDTPDISGQIAGCIQNDSNAYYMFYQVLVAR